MIDLTITQYQQSIKSIFIRMFFFSIIKNHNMDGSFSTTTSPDTTTTNPDTTTTNPDTTTTSPDTTTTSPISFYTTTLSPVNQKKEISDIILISLIICGIILVAIGVFIFQKIEDKNSRYFFAGFGFVLILIGGVMLGMKKRKG